MFLVAGGIYVHNIDTLHELLHMFPGIIAELGVGGFVGFVALFSVVSFKHTRNYFS